MDESALAEPDAGLLQRLRLTEGAYLKRAAVLLFHPDPLRHVGGAFVKIGFFRSQDEHKGVSVKISVKTPEADLSRLPATSPMILAEVAVTHGKTSRAIELAKAGRIRFAGPQRGCRGEVLA